MLTAEQKASLEQTLTAFEARSELAVLMVRLTAPEAIEPTPCAWPSNRSRPHKKVDDGAILLSP